MSQATGQSNAVRISPKTIETIQMLAAKIQHTPSRVAYIIIDGTLPSMEAVTKSYEGGILSVARWLDKLMSWTLKGVRQKVAKKAAELQAEGKLKVKEAPKVTFTVWLPNEVIERIDIIAKRFYMTRGKLIALILEASMNRFTVGTGVNLAAFHDFVLSLGHDLSKELDDQPTEQ